MIHQLTSVHQFLMRSMSSESIIDVVEALVDSSTPIRDETYVYEDIQESQEAEIESIVVTFSVSSSTKS